LGQGLGLGVGVDGGLELALAVCAEEVALGHEGEHQHRAVHVLLELGEVVELVHVEPHLEREQVVNIRSW